MAHMYNTEIAQVRGSLQTYRATIQTTQRLLSGIMDKYEAEIVRIGDTKVPELRTKCNGLLREMEEMQYTEASIDDALAALQSAITRIESFIL